MLNEIPTSHDFGSERIRGFEIHGLGSSTDPDPLPVRLAILGPDWGWYGGSAKVSADLTASGSTGNRTAPAGQTQLGAIGSCGAECGIVSTFVEIRDPDADEEVSTPGVCFNKYDEAEVCVTETEFVNADRRIPISSTCSPGSGSFRLIPIHAKDADNDGSKSMVFRAIQTNGTGTLTAAAWITAIEPTQTRSRPLRAIKVGAEYRFSSSDALVDASLVSSALSLTSETQFNTGIIGGNAPFVSEEIPTDTYLDWTVDLTWECDTPNEFEDVAPPQGYTFTLSALGCPGSYPQKFVIRPNSSTTPTSMTVTLYGAVSDPDWVPLTSTNDGYAFTWSKAGLVVEGRLISQSAQTGAEVAVDSVTWQNSSVCEMDTHTFPPEE